MFGRNAAAAIPEGKRGYGLPFSEKEVLRARRAVEKLNTLLKAECVQSNRIYGFEEKDMRRLTCITAALIILCIAGTAFASSSKEDSDLLIAREAVWRNWFAGDIQALEKLVPKEALAINAGEEKWQAQAEIFQEATQFHASGAKLIRLEFPRTEIQRFGNVAILYSKYQYEVESNGKRSINSGRATEVFVLTNGQWTNPGWHTDRDQ
jgi:Domain of unknown function (DUF4440)